MRHSDITTTGLIDNRLVFNKVISLLTMAKTISKKISVIASASKPSGKPLIGDKTFGLGPAIRFYAIEDRDETEKGK